MAPELSTKADNLIVALGRLAAAQENHGGAPEVDTLLRTAVAAHDEMAGLLGIQRP